MATDDASAQVTPGLVPDSFWDLLDGILEPHDLEGNRIGILELFALEEAAAARGEVYRRVALDRVGPFEVSTVLLPSPSSAGMLFETLVSGPSEFTDRYATLSEARLGHARMLERLIPLC